MLATLPSRALSHHSISAFLSPRPLSSLFFSPPCLAITSSSPPTSRLLAPITFPSTPQSSSFHRFFPSSLPLLPCPCHSSIMLSGPASLSLPFSFPPDPLDIPLSPPLPPLYATPLPLSLSPEVDSSVRSQPYLPPLFAPVYIIDRQGCFSSTIHQHLPSLPARQNPSTPALLFLPAETQREAVRWRWGFNEKAESERGMLGCVRDLCVKEQTCWMVCMEHVLEKVCTEGRRGCVLYKSMCVTDSRRVHLFIP